MTVKMTNLNEVRSANAALVQHQPLVAVFFGGTSGIGHYTLRALATEVAKNGKGLRAYIVGRNGKAAEEIIDECTKIYPNGRYTFTKVEDISLLETVDETCSEIHRLESEMRDDARIDYLMLSQGGAIYKPRKGLSLATGRSDNTLTRYLDTKEGLDMTMSLMYYSRMKAITNLLPLLRKSNLPARVISVYAGGMEGKFYPNDLSLRDLTRYSYTVARSHMCYMHTLFMESLAEQNSGKLSLTHIFPGIVMGPGFSSPELPAWFRFPWHWIVIPLFGRFITVPSDECGQRMLSLASSRYPPRKNDESASREGLAMGTDGKLGGGVYTLTWNGESKTPSVEKYYSKFDKDEMRAKVWEHTTSAFRVIEGGGVFAD